MIASLQQAQGAQQAQNNASAAPSLAPISGPPRPASATPSAVRPAPAGVKPESPASGGSGGDGSDADGEDGNRKRGPGTPTKGGDGESGLTGALPPAPLGLHASCPWLIIFATLLLHSRETWQQAPSHHVLAAKVFAVRMMEHQSSCMGEHVLQSHGLLLVLAPDQPRAQYGSLALVSRVK